MRIRSRAAALLASAAVLTTASLALTSCSLAVGTSEHEWRSTDAMSRSADGAAVPSLVASDARDIRLSMPSVGKGGTFLAWRSTSGVTRDDCEPDRLGTPPSSAKPSWWPGSVPHDGMSCGWWRVFEQDRTFYAWQQLDSQR